MTEKESSHLNDELLDKMIQDLIKSERETIELFVKTFIISRLEKYTKEELRYIFKNFKLEIQYSDSLSRTIKLVRND